VERGAHSVPRKPSHRDRVHIRDYLQPSHFCTTLHTRNIIRSRNLIWGASSRSLFPSTYDRVQETLRRHVRLSRLPFQNSKTIQLYPSTTATQAPTWDTRFASVVLMRMIVYTSRPGFTLPRCAIIERQLVTLPYLESGRFARTLFFGSAFFYGYRVAGPLPRQYGHLHSRLLYLVLHQLLKSVGLFISSLPRLRTARDVALVREHAA
jgi:hypothetical protein